MRDLNAISLEGSKKSQATKSHERSRSTFRVLKRNGSYSSCLPHSHAPCSDHTFCFELFWSERPRRSGCGKPAERTSILSGALLVLCNCHCYHHSLYRGASLSRFFAKL